MAAQLGGWGREGLLLCSGVLSRLTTGLLVTVALVGLPLRDAGIILRLSAQGPHSPTRLWCANKTTSLYSDGNDQTCPWGVRDGSCGGPSDSSFPTPPWALGLHQRGLDVQDRELPACLSAHGHGARPSGGEACSGPARSSWDVLSPPGSLCLTS